MKHTRLLAFTVILALSFMGCSSTGALQGEEKVPLPKPFIEISQAAKEIHAKSPFTLKVDLMVPAGSFRSPQIPLPRLLTGGVHFNKRRRFQFGHSSSSIKGLMWDVFSFRTELIALSKGKRDLEFRWNLYC